MRHPAPRTNPCVKPASFPLPHTRPQCFASPFAAAPLAATPFAMTGSFSSASCKTSWNLGSLTPSRMQLGRPKLLQYLTGQPAASAAALAAAAASGEWHSTKTHGTHAGERGLGVKASARMRSSWRVFQSGRVDHVFSRYATSAQAATVKSCAAVLTDQGVCCFFISLMRAGSATMEPMRRPGQDQSFVQELMTTRDPGNLSRMASADAARQSGPRNGMKDSSTTSIFPAAWIAAASASSASSPITSPVGEFG
mmetsp:Transcript_17069/g.43750  ORF Transcript_17069/g.43750 Transcript_17069/m.43750 type:complete len:253 (+) Transcript_17069:295-1053(+)